MPPNEASSVSVSRRGHGRLGSEPGHTVVWVRGEHDIATRVSLSASVARAILRDDADIVVDLSGVTFMDASTIGALVAARNRLRACSRSLSVRAPSPRARRLLDLCGLAPMIDEPALPVQVAHATALGSWVDVPAADRDPGSAAPAAEAALPPELARAIARRRVASEESNQHRRATS